MLAMLIFNMMNRRLATCPAEKVAAYVICMMHNTGIHSVAYGDGVLVEIAHMAWPNSNMHPLVAMERVLSSLDRYCKQPNALLEKRLMTVQTGHKRLVTKRVRLFVLKEDTYHE